VPTAHRRREHPSGPTDADQKRHTPVQKLRPRRLVLGHSIFDIGFYGLAQKARYLIKGRTLNSDIEIKTDRFPVIARTMRDTFEGKFHGHISTTNGGLGS
jgi:hypothetical protein